MTCIQRKPDWLLKKKDIVLNRDMKKMLRDFNLHTVCESAKCPNISECFSKNTATFMVLGDVCTRDCRFCGVKKDNSLAKQIDHNEAENIIEVINKLKLKYVVITMVTRDDLDDGGAGHIADIIKKIKAKSPDVLVEILVSDFYSFSNRENYKNLLKFNLIQLVEAGAHVIGHNIETVRDLYPKIRKVADYDRSIFVLKMMKVNSVFTKSGIMLGLGETKEQIQRTLQDVLQTGCDILTIGQYLMPSKNHYPLDRYVKEEEFEYWKNYALNLGFKAVESAPFVRSSYKAKEIWEKLNKESKL